MKKSSGYQSRFKTIDRVTGEEVEGTPVYVAGKVKWNKERWFVGFQDAFATISEDKEMTLEVTRVWMQLVSKMGFENFVYIPQKEVAESLNIQRSQVSRSIKKLVNKGLLVEGPKINRASSYRLNLDHVWKGSGDEYKKNTDRLKKISAKELAKERWKEVANPAV